MNCTSYINAYYHFDAPFLYRPSCCRLFRGAELVALSELLCRLKSLGALLEDAGPWLQPLLHAAMYAQAQTFVQATLNGLLKPSAPAKELPNSLPGALMKCLL